MSTTERILNNHVFPGHHGVGSAYTISDQVERLEGQVARLRTVVAVLAVVLVAMLAAVVLVITGG